MISYYFLEPEGIDPKDSGNIADNDAEDINMLRQQLTTSAMPMTYAELIRIAQHSDVLVARDESKHIKGMATLCAIYKPTGRSGVIEDVVVDVSLRGQHVGERLVMILIKRAAAMSLNRLELTSKPERIAANKLYQKLGFKLRETNCYTLTL
jgi:ribosomal protein S18 acetylase RimI-like enzyme